MKTLIVISFLLAGTAAAISTVALMKVNKLLTIEKTPALTQPLQPDSLLLCQDNNDQNTCRLPEK